jgi:predicted metal-dependent hydrolase
MECVPYLFAFDLFNRGYYWEAHETWESLWQACGRSGRTADFLKALIKLAAAGVKVREGQLAGVRSHARRAAQLVEQLQAQSPSGQVRFLGVDLLELAGFCRQVIASPPPCAAAGNIVFEHLLLPAETAPP